MATFSIRMEKIKEGFFDRAKVLRALGKENHAILMKFGLATRRRALKSLKYDDKPSKPGEPPHAHKTRTKKFTSKKTGKVRVRRVSFLREFLYSSYDSTAKSIIIGPTKLDQVAGLEVPSVLEHGGTATIKTKVKKLPGQKGKATFETRKVHMAPRPFMNPAGMEELKAVPEMWKNAIR
jgi:hypothetical protein